MDIGISSVHALLIMERSSLRFQGDFACLANRNRQLDDLLPVPSFYIFASISHKSTLIHHLLIINLYKETSNLGVIKR